MRVRAGFLGPAVLAAVAVGYPVVWLLAAPAGQPAGLFAGEICGAEAVLLFSCSLVLLTLLPFIEHAFGGLDRVVVWHRRVAFAGFALLVAHVALITSTPDPFETTLGHALGDVALAGLLVLIAWAAAPRLRAARWPGPIRALARTSYEHWLGAHRLTGLFVAVAVIHGAIVDPVMRSSSVIRAAFVVVGVIGVGAYAYRELLARYFVPVYEYTVGSSTGSASARSRSRSTPLASGSPSNQASSSCWPSAARAPGSATRSRSRAPPPIAASTSPSRPAATTRADSWTTCARACLPRW
jgi:hypothetical protein